MVLHELGENGHEAFEVEQCFPVVLRRRPVEYRFNLVKFYCLPHLLQRGVACALKVLPYITISIPYSFFTLREKQSFPIELILSI